MPDPNDNSIVKILREATSVVTALTALVVSIVALSHAIPAYNKADNAIAQNGKTSDKIGEIVASTAPSRSARVNPSTNAAGTPPSPATSFYLQLATYKMANCSAAQAEINGYGAAFEPKASLWTDPSGGYVVVGIKGSSLDNVKTRQAKAAVFSRDPSQAGNDLAHAIIRTNPLWTPITCDSAPN